MKLVSRSVASVLLLVAAHAHAEEEERRVHDGFYLRGDAGIGNFAATSSSPSRSTRSFHGTSFSWALFVGGNLAPGCSGGGAIAFDRAYAITGRDETTGPIDATGLHLQHRLLGPFVDCYFTPRGGPHLWGVVGPAKITVSRDGQLSSPQTDSTPDPSGVGFQFGVGYDAWIGSDISLGIAFRLTYAPLSVDEIGVEVPVKVLIPALLFNVIVN